MKKVLKNNIKVLLFMLMFLKLSKKIKKNKSGIKKNNNKKRTFY